MTNQNPVPEKLDPVGITTALLAFFLWGILPIYWKNLQTVPSIEILAHRICWSLVYLGIIIVIRKKYALMGHLRSRKVRLAILTASIILGMNWFTYIFAVNTDHIVQASLGYYISPLFTIAVGMIFFRERLSRLQKGAILLAAIGVIAVATEYGKIPWIALLIATTFSLYGTAKKLSPLDALSGLFTETLILTPFSLAYILFLARSGDGAFGTAPPAITALLILSGIATSLPLLLFGISTRRIPLVSVGFLQYLSPTMMLLIGVLLYREPFTLIHGVSFGFIWAALALYSVSLVRNARKAHDARR